MENTEDAFLLIHDLSKGYGKGDSYIKVLRGVTADIRKGEICVLLGPSGSGKSTFLNIIGGLEHADGGSIILGGKELTKLGEKDLGEYRRAQLGFVFQFYNLVPDLTIRENIEVCEYLSKDPLEVEGLLKSLELWDHRNKFPKQVSGGQQQRCAIGRALVKNPSLLLCDEPTGALDYSTSKEILALIEQINDDYGCTVIIVTHNEAIAHMAHRILRLHDGKMIENIVNDDRRHACDLEW